MATRTKVMSDFELFVNSGLHNAVWPNVTCAVVPAPVFGTPIVVRNEPGTHAEEIIVALIRTAIATQRATGTLKPGTTLNIKILQNFSPCVRCSDKYFRLQEDLKLFSIMCGVRFTMEVVFSAFYHIERPSCALHNHAFTHSVDARRHESNVGGIRRLLTAGVFVRPFLEDDWRELASSLIGATLLIRQAEDLSMMNDFRMIFNPRL